MNPYPSWLNAGDNSWQMTAATLVGLMSIPALAVLYGGLVQKKWAINTVMMVFTTFCLVLITWVLWGYKLGFGTPLVNTFLGVHGGFLGDPRTVLGHNALQGQANIPLLNGLMPNFRIPAGSVIYFQFVFAAITPILFIGSVIGRISFKVWLVFVPLWITFAYCVNAFLLWGFKLGFGTPLVNTFLGAKGGFIGDPRTVLGHSALQGQANIPLLNGLMPSFSGASIAAIYSNLPESFTSAAATIHPLRSAPQ